MVTVTKGYAVLPTFRDLAVPDVVYRMLDAGADTMLSFSGGGDSQAMLEAVAALHVANAYAGALSVAHADLGRAEWSQTPGHVRFVCDRLALPLAVVNRVKGDLVAQIVERHETMKARGQSAPPFPDAKNRYCTSDQKRSQLDKVVRNPWPTSTMRYCTADNKRDQLARLQRKSGGLVLVGMGMRADESPARRKRPIVSVNKRLTSKALLGLSPEDALAAHQPKHRLVLDWLPIHHWTKADVWRACGSSSEDLEERRALWSSGEKDRALIGWPAHPAYVMGNERLSCAICILGCKGDLENGARARPEVLREYIRIEIESGFTFQQGKSLRSLEATRDLFPDLYVDARPTSVAQRSGQMSLAL